MGREKKKKRGPPFSWVAARSGKHRWEWVRCSKVENRKIVPRLFSSTLQHSLLALLSTHSDLTHSSSLILGHSYHSPSPVDSNGERWVSSHDPKTLPTKITLSTTLPWAHTHQAHHSAPHVAVCKKGAWGNQQTQDTVYLQLLFSSWINNRNYTSLGTKLAVSGNLIIFKGPNRDEYLNPCHWNVMITTWFPLWGTASYIKWPPWFPYSGLHTLCDPLPLS